MADGDHGAVHRLGCLILCLLPAIASAQSIPPQAEQYRRDLTRIAYSVWGLDAPVATLAGMAYVESRWNPDAVSPVGASGLMQVMPRTGAALSRIYDIGPVDLFDPRWSMLAAATLLKETYTRFKPNRTRPSAGYMAIAGYNGSPATLQREITLCAMDLHCDETRWFANVADKSDRLLVYWQQNRKYVISVIGASKAYEAAGWGPAF